MPVKVIAQQQTEEVIYNLDVYLPARIAVTTLPGTNSSPMKIQFFLANTMKMVDFPASDLLVYRGVPGVIWYIFWQPANPLSRKPTSMEHPGLEGRPAASWA